MRMNQDERRFDFHGLGLALKRAREEKGWTQAYDDDIPDNLAACADYAGSLSGTGVYRSGCCTPTP